MAGLRGLKEPMSISNILLLSTENTARIPAARAPLCRDVMAFLLTYLRRRSEIEMDAPALCTPSRWKRRKGKVWVGPGISGIIKDGTREGWKDCPRDCTDRSSLLSPTVKAVVDG